MKTLALIILILYSKFSCAQAEKQPERYIPKIGDTIFDYTFDDVVNDRNTINIRDYRGKWLVLDFWASNCYGCIASFEKMDKLQKTFKDSVKLIMIGAHNGNNDTREGRARAKVLYDRNAKMYDLKFTVAFDSVLADKIGVYGVPQILVVNPEGRIMAKTMKLDSGDMRIFLKGETPKLRYSYSLSETEYSIHNLNTPLLTNGKQSNGGNDTSFFYRSMFKKWEEGLPVLWYGFNGGMNNKINRDKYPDRAEIFGLDLPCMLRICYLGLEDFMFNMKIADTIYRNIVVETSNPEIFAPKNDYNHKNAYCYSLTGAFKDVDQATKYLLADLERVFKFKSSLESRDVPVWKLIIIDSNKVRSHESKYTVKSRKPNGIENGSILQNYTPQDLAKSGILTKALLTKYEGHNIYDVLPIIDDTNVKYGLDFKMIGYEKDFEAKRKSLNAIGLDLVPGKHVFKCIVVRDR